MLVNATLDSKLLTDIVSIWSVQLNTPSAFVDRTYPACGVSGNVYVVTPLRVFGALNSILLDPSLSTNLSPKEVVPSSLDQYLPEPKNLLSARVSVNPT